MAEIETYPFREPILGEILFCAVCGQKCTEIDEEWLKNYYKMTLERRLRLFNPDEDYFMGYDGCEDNDPSDAEPTWIS